MNVEYRCINRSYDAGGPICVGVKGGVTVTSYASTPAVPAVFLSPPLIVRLLAPVPIHEACDLAIDVARCSHAASAMGV